MKVILVDAWNTFITKKGIFDEMYHMLESYKEYKIILTNADTSEQIKFGMINLPYELFSLCHSPNKSDPKYYRSLLEAYSLSTDDVIYFEHELEAVKSARSVDIITHHYDYEEKDLVELKTFFKKYLSD